MNNIIEKAKSAFASCCDERDINAELKKINAEIQQARVCGGITVEGKNDLLRVVKAAALNAKGRLRSAV